MRDNRVLKASGGWMLLLMGLTLFGAVVYVADARSQKTHSASAQVSATATPTPPAPTPPPSPTVTPLPLTLSGMRLTDLTQEELAQWRNDWVGMVNQIWSDQVNLNTLANTRAVQDDLDLVIIDAGADLFSLIRTLDASITGARFAEEEAFTLVNAIAAAQQDLDATLANLQTPPVIQYVPEPDLETFLRLCDVVFWEASAEFRSYHFTFDGGRKASCDDGESS